MRSASGVVGPLAASTTMRARTAPALPACSTPPTAAGTRTSHSQRQQLVVGDPLDVHALVADHAGPGPANQLAGVEAGGVPDAARRRRSPPRSGSRGARGRPRRGCRRCRSPGSRPARPRSGIPIAPAASRATTATPSPVASTRPTVPPSSTGLPVTIAGVWPWSRPYSSISHAISAGPVPMSGAMMSRIGPSTFSSRSITARVARWSSAGESPLGSRSIPPLAPPKGRPASAVFQVIPAASARTPSRSTAGW